jgi:two-component system, NarL family, nitrate/nitrite response regulator NarL
MVTEKAIRVMLIDDHKTMLWGLERLIAGQKSRMEVVGVASTCEEALAQIDKADPDVILLDLDLDGKNSLDILPGLLANGRSRALVFTGTREPATLHQAVLLGARGVLHKDASAELVLKAVEKVYQGELWLDREMLGRVLGGFMNQTTTRKPDLDAERIATLTDRERKIVGAIVEGKGAMNKTIAQRLFISDHTLRNHLTSIYQKLCVANRLELYVYAMKHQLGTTPSEGNSMQAVKIAPALGQRELA